MSLREHRLPFRVLPVPASVRPAGHKSAGFTDRTRSKVTRFSNKDFAFGAQL